MLHKDAKLNSTIYLILQRKFAGRMYSDKQAKASGSHAPAWEPIPGFIKIKSYAVVLIQLQVIAFLYFSYSNNNASYNIFNI
jgi:hypothetical protein